MITPHATPRSALTKLRTSFLDTLPARAVAALAPAGTAAACASSSHSPTSPRLYTRWMQLATGTGRLAAKHANVQQIPSTDTPLLSEDGEPRPPIIVRAAFVAPPGHILIAADYRQLEMRLLAHLSGDAALARNLRDGSEDLFRLIGAHWRRCDPAALSAEVREQTKQVSYGIVYGLGDAGLAAKLDLSGSQAAELRANFLRAFPTLARLQERCKVEAREHGGVLAISGRMRPLPSIRSSNPAERSKAERQAVDRDHDLLSISATFTYDGGHSSQVNSVIQGSAADVVKEAMLRCAAALASRRCATCPPHLQQGH